MKLIAVILFYVTCVLSAKLPDKFKRCSLKDEACLKTAAQEGFPKFKDGLPDYGVPSTDPLVIPEMTIGAGEKVVQLVQKYKNVKLEGLSTAKLGKFKFDLNEGKIEMELLGDKMTMHGEYNANGKILLLPVKGFGKFLIHLEKPVGLLAFNVEIVTIKDRKYIKVKSASLKLDVAHADYDFENLFDKNKEISENLNTVLNDNWREIFDELSPSYSEAYAQVLMQVMDRFFSKIPMSELFLDQ